MHARCTRETSAPYCSSSSSFADAWTSCFSVEGGGSATNGDRLATAVAATAQEATELQLTLLERGAAVASRRGRGRKGGGGGGKVGRVRQGGGDCKASYAACGGDTRWIKRLESGGVDGTPQQQAGLMPPRPPVPPTPPPPPPPTTGGNDHLAEENTRLRARLDEAEASAAEANRLLADAEGARRKLKRQLHDATSSSAAGGGSTAAVAAEEVVDGTNTLALREEAHEAEALVEAAAALSEVSGLRSEVERLKSELEESRRAKEAETAWREEAVTTAAAVRTAEREEARTFLRTAEASVLEARGFSAAVSKELENKVGELHEAKAELKAARKAVARAKMEAEGRVKQLDDFMSRRFRKLRTQPTP